MAVKRAWLILCDSCPEVLASDHSAETDARTEAAALGWALKLPSGGCYDYCPECKKEGD